MCGGIVSLLYRAPEKLTPNMREVITYMIERTADGDEDVALESCEFWAGGGRLKTLCTNHTTRFRLDLRGLAPPKGKRVLFFVFLLVVVNGF